MTQVCVLPEYRSHGIGRIVDGSDYSEPASAKILLASLTVTEANDRAVELYFRLGFDTQKYLTHSSGKVIVSTFKIQT